MAGDLATCHSPNPIEQQAFQNSSATGTNSLNLVDIHHQRHHHGASGQTKHTEVGHHHLQGIDVYAGNGPVNWQKARADHVSFAFIKASEGVTIKDESFDANWQGAQKAGIVRGAYHYFRPDCPIQEQINNFVGAVKHLKRGDLAPVLDLEEPQRWDQGSTKKNVEKVLEWLRGVRKELGMNPIVYMSSGFAEQVLGGDKRLAKYHLWLANYNTTSPETPRPFGKYSFLQYSNCGRVHGACGKVDRDYFAGTRAELNKLRKA